MGLNDSYHAATPVKKTFNPIRDELSGVMGGKNFSRVESQLFFWITRVYYDSIKGWRCWKSSLEV
ncbi:MAG: hypothetical protein ONA90_03115, partial [candidate division KSB1 bacterium]|nr:hypothetical protein [candidate division KSB1 bacterium]